MPLLSGDVDRGFRILRSQFEPLRRIQYQNAAPLHGKQRVVHRRTRQFAEPLAQRRKPNPSAERFIPQFAARVEDSGLQVLGNGRRGRFDRGPLRLGLPL